MPRGDGTGPAGMGPMTGRAAGFCAGYGMPGFMNPGPARGFWGFGRGRGGFGGGYGGGGGRGWRNRFFATGLTGWQRAGYGPYPQPGAFASGPSADEEIESLKAQAQYFQDALEEIRTHIENLEARKQSKD